MGENRARRAAMALASQRRTTPARGSFRAHADAVDVRAAIRAGAVPDLVLADIETVTIDKQGAAPIAKRVFAALTRHVALAHVAQPGFGPDLAGAAQRRQRRSAARRCQGCGRCAGTGRTARGHPAALRGSGPRADWTWVILPGACQSNSQDRPAHAGGALICVSFRARSSQSAMRARQAGQNSLPLRSVSMSMLLKCITHAGSAQCSRPNV